MSVPEEDYPWPPIQAPTNQDVELAWDMLHKQAKEYMLRAANDPGTRGFLRKMKAQDLLVRLRPQLEHEGDVNEDSTRHDNRPFFGNLGNSNDTEEGDAASPDAEEGEAQEDMEPAKNEEEEQGDLEVRGTEPRFQTETKFCIELSYERQGRRSDERQLHDFSYRDIGTSPEQALHLLCKLQSRAVRKIVADALVFKFLEDESEGQHAEEQEDGGVAPNWRGQSLDPAADALIVCSHLQELYRSILEGKDA